MVENLDVWESWCLRMMMRMSETIKLEYLPNFLGIPKNSLSDHNPPVSMWQDMISPELFAKRFLRFSGYHDSQKTNLLDHKCTIFPQLTNLCTKVTFKVLYLYSYCITSHHISYSSMFFCAKTFFSLLWQLDNFRGSSPSTKSLQELDKVQLLDLLGWA